MSNSDLFGPSFKRRSSLMLKVSGSPTGSCTDVDAFVPRERVFSVHIDGLGAIDIPTDSEGRTPAWKQQTSGVADTHGVRDLATLARLDEQAILDELSLRYSHNLIYTNVGDILIAVNPFQSLIDVLYSDQVAASYFHDREPSSVPHVFQIAQAAYKHLLHEHKDQCCVISGESGSGKTESAKFLIEQILAMCKGTGKLEQRIMQANPLLEAFGNAQTVMNNNSSRFGKFLEVKFGYFGDVLGAKMAQYLLEKSRVVHQGDRERNFHVFYFLFADRTTPSKQQLLQKLKLGDITDYRYLRGGSSNTTEDVSIDIDYQSVHGQFEQLCECMLEIGFSAQEVDTVWEVIATILHIGNIEFDNSDTDDAVVTTPEVVETVCGFLGAETEALTFAMQSTVHMTRGEPLQTNYSLVQAEGNRDATSKAIYGHLFSWIVNKINSLLGPKGPRYERACEMENGVTEIGILDIFGFENFEHNSFEQFCINVANEQLQFYFNQHIFANELQQYEEQGLETHGITYSDNSRLLEMVLAKPLGLFALLDEESRFPRASAQSLGEKFFKAKEQCQWSFFETTDPKSKPRRPTINLLGGLSKTQGSEAGPFFTIRHFAGPVIYDCAGFVEKNRDTLSETVVNIMRSCTGNMLIKEFFAPPPVPLEDFDAVRGRSVRRKAENKLSVSALFKNSLLSLITKMTASKPHFIRCIKPNDAKKPQIFDQQRVLTQLRNTGVLETTRIRRDGYAIRMPFQQFYNRYKSLAFDVADMPVFEPGDVNSEELRAACRRIVKRAGLRGAQLGQSLLFLKYFHGDKLMRFMEKQHQSATQISKLVRGFLARRLLHRLRAEELARRQEQARLEQERRAAELAREKEEAERAAQLARAETTRRKALEKAKEAERKMAQEAAEAEQKRLEDEKRQRELEEQEAELKRMADRARAEAAAAAAATAAAPRHSIIALEDPESEELQAELDKSQDDDDGGDAFAFLLDDDELDADERLQLREMQARRRAEEDKRKRDLAEEYRKARLEEEERAMRELQRIVEEEAKKKEEEAKKAQADAKETEQRIQAMDFGSFGFSWGAPAPTPAPAAKVEPTPAPAAKAQQLAEEEEPPALPPPPAVPEELPVPPPADKFVDATPETPLSPGLPPPPLAPDADDLLPKDMPELPPPPSAEALSAKQESKAIDEDQPAPALPPPPNCPPPNAPPPGLSLPPPPDMPPPPAQEVAADKEGSCAAAEVGETATAAGSDAEGSPRSRTVSEAKRQGPAKKPKPQIKKKPVGAMAGKLAGDLAGAAHAAAAKGKEVAEKRASLMTAAAPSSSSSSEVQQQAVVQQEPQHTPQGAEQQTKEPIARTTKRLSVSFAQPETEEPDAAISEADAAENPVEDKTEEKPAEATKKPRRKLVRGGNQHKPTYVPGWLEAMDALSDLDTFLDDPALVETEATPEVVRGLSQVLLLDQTSVCQDEAEEKAKFIQGAMLASGGSGILQRTESHSGVRIHGFKLSPADLMRIDEQQRVALLQQVKEGRMSVDECLEQVIETRQRQNCVIC